MIISRLNGGLGNQLFQYAAAKALALKNNTELYLDLSVLEKERIGTIKRTFALSAFNIHAKFASSELIKKIEERTPINRLLEKYKVAKKSIYNEPHYHFDPSFFKIRGNAIINGYLQSSRYFEEEWDIIRSDFAIRASLTNETSSVARLIENTNSIGIHIRRGDYITDPHTKDQHGICSPEYYKKAVSIIATKISINRLFLFSDDTGWVKKNFTSSFPITFVDHNDEAHAYEDLFLMSRCRHNIIANSSFSWWAAWLNNNPGKIVIAPAKWFNASTANTKDLLPEEWIKI